VAGKFRKPNNKWRFIAGKIMNGGFSRMSYLMTGSYFD
jgi:hypothetical protein